MSEKISLDSSDSKPLSDRIASHCNEPHLQSAMVCNNQFSSV